MGGLTVGGNNSRVYAMTATVSDRADGLGIDYRLVSLEADDLDTIDAVLRLPSSDAALDVQVSK